MTFVNRTYFIQTLGIDYLGVSGLYANILTILSLAELGIGNVLIFALYKPILHKDHDMIASLLKFYQKIYRVVAVCVLGIGLLVVPFLHLIVQSDIEYNRLILYYFMLLLNSVLSYFIIYKTILLNADQKNYILKIVTTGMMVLKDIIQIIVLITTESYAIYIAVLVISTLLTNIILSFITSRMYPFINKKDILKIVDTTSIKENIKSAFIYKIGVVVMNNTDNILISVIVGTMFVGLYSNYNLLITAVSTLIGILIQGVFSSIGSLNAEDDNNKSYH